MIALVTTIRPASAGAVKRRRIQYQIDMAPPMHSSVMSLSTANEPCEIFMAPASTSGQPGGQMLTDCPLNVCPLPSTQFRATATYSSLSPPGTQNGLYKSRYIAKTIPVTASQMRRACRKASIGTIVRMTDFPINSLECEGEVAVMKADYVDDATATC